MLLRATEVVRFLLDGGIGCKRLEVRQLELHGVTIPSLGTSGLRFVIRLTEAMAAGSALMTPVVCGTARAMAGHVIKGSLELLLGQSTRCISSALALASAAMGLGIALASQKEPVPSRNCHLLAAR